MSTPSWNGELADTARSSGQPVAERGHDPHRAIGAADRDVGVDAEGVVAPDDVPEDLVVAPVVRRVDDPLIAPARPGVRPRGPEREAEWLDERGELGAALGEGRRDVRERRLLPGLDLDLGRDQLADEIRLERGASHGSLHVLEAIDEVERLGVEQRELLLDGDREVLCRLEALERLVEDLLARPRAGRLAH